MKAPVLGVAIGPAAVHAALVVRGRCEWQAHVPRTALSDALVTLLAQVPRAKRRRPPQLVVALAYPDAQVKKLCDLPATTDVALLTAAVAQHLSRFFVRGSGALRSSVVVPLGVQTAWGAAYNEQVLADVAHVAIAAALPLRAIVPLAWALAARLSDGAVRLECDGIVQEVTVAAHALVDVALRVGGAGTSATWSEMLADAAIGAAALDLRSAPIALGIGVGAAGGSASRARQWMLPVLSLTVSLGLLAFLPLALATHATNAARGRLLALAPHRPAAIAAARRAAVESGNRLALSRFTNAMPPRTLLLAAIAAALPDSAAITRLHFDSTSVELTIVATHLGPAVDALARTPALRGVELLNGVSRRGTTAGLEQGVVRFTVPRGHASMPGALEQAALGQLPK